jgi:hypothetical protein
MNPDTGRDNYNALYRLIQAFDFALLLLAAARL